MNGVYMETRLQDDGDECNNSTETTTVKLIMDYDHLIFTTTGVANMTARVLRRMTICRGQRQASLRTDKYRFQRRTMTSDS